MTSAALEAALADIDTVFHGFASPDEVGCGRCHLPEETAFLRTSDIRMPLDVLERFVYEVPDHFDDHAAAMRRLLPQAARAMADGSLGGPYLGAHGLIWVNWRSWPADQARAIETFLHAWWQDVLSTPRPPYPVKNVFETCITIAGTVTPFLAGWHRQPSAETHLVQCVDDWIYDLISDCSPFSWWGPDGEDEAVAELKYWLSRHAADRLRAQGEPDLAFRAELLALPYDERWAHPYWTNPSATS
ncbi:hypothetical protein [Streptomyces sp. NBC_01236]|uniref:hypothetical protein n=1 Tax=Streptomyces sp. NBC_01236 TaxID=2903789 RepID=UPI002E15295C|nr:hypothetical protein OG324_10365 [Streptomyces sp. NBC_01236]